MPVHHEKTDKPRKPADPTMIVNRNKQREVSVERRPIISQEKPANVKKAIKADPQKGLAKRQEPKMAQSSSRTTGRRSDQGLKGKTSESTGKVSSKDIARTSKPKVTPKPIAGKNVPTSSQRKPELPNKPRPSKPVAREETREKRQTVRDRTRTRTLSPSEVSVLKILKEPPENHTAATEAVEVQDKTESNHEEEEDDDYEDDFEDYESDFESDSEEEEPAEETKESVAEVSRGAEEPPERRRVAVSARGRERERREDEGEGERKLDSGSYHLTHKREIEDIRAAMLHENRIRLPEDTDEGYIEPQERTPAIKNQILDFTQAEQRSKTEESQNKVKKRGELLSKMITLDEITYSLMEVPSVPYNVFMASYGKSNYTQVHVQTNEDDSEVDVQTDLMETDIKWTQMPATYSIVSNGAYRLPTKQERNGVGSWEDEPIEEGQWKTTNVNNLSKFISLASRNVLSCLEARTKQSSSKTENSALPCCEKMTKFSRQDSENMPVHLVVASQTSILTIQNSEGKSLLDVWLLSDLSTPRYSLLSRSPVICACFGPGGGHLVFAGAQDGSVNLWDCQEKSLHHSGCLRSPTYSTAHVAKGLGHSSPVASVHVLARSLKQGEERWLPIQVCSLSEEGQVVIWTVVQLSRARENINEDGGLAPWGAYKLVHSASFNADTFISREGNILNTPRFLTMTTVASSALLIAEKGGKVAHCSTDGTAMKPKCFLPGQVRISPVTALTVYPSGVHFLAGCEDGTVRLHNFEKEAPLICLHWNLSEIPKCPRIKALHWLSSKPCMFYALDSKARIHVWNLAESDIYPQMSLPPGKDLCHCATSGKFGSEEVIVFGRSSGTIEIHYVKQESDRKLAKEHHRKELKMFQKYVKIL